jgi:outer membrane protein TolC
VGLRERVAIAQLNLSFRAAVEAGGVPSRYGAATSVELAQQRGQVAAQQRVVALLRKQLADAHAVLALLSGQWAMDLVSEASLSNLAIPAFARVRLRT